MPVTENTEKKTANEIWIISDGRPVHLDLSRIGCGPVAGLATEYNISELARYLLNPNQITLKEKIIGCKLKYRSPATGRIKRMIRKLMPVKKTSAGGKSLDFEEIISTSKIGAPNFADRAFNAYCMKISNLLRLYDPVQKKLAGLDTAKIENILAICEDVGKNRYQLNLQGSINEKIDYVTSSISKKVNVVFSKAYLMNGLFEMRGFHFDSFNAQKASRLIKFNQNDETKYCVVNAGKELEYWVNDHSLINYVHLFEQSIKTDPKLREALSLCMTGDASPLKLFFSKQSERSYSEKRLPSIYQEVFGTYNLSVSERIAVANTLNRNQSIVFFSYVPRSGAGKRQLFTNISVMHDFRALEPIKSILPQVYSEISKKTSVSDAGKFYLLDSLRGFQNV